MNFRLFKIFIVIMSFFLFTGFAPVISIIGPTVTVLTSGNIYKAGAQFLIDSEIKRKTGKNSLTLVKEEMTKQNSKKNFQEELNQLIKKRIAITQKN